jgi:hypothetical protein
VLMEVTAGPAPRLSSTAKRSSRRVGL